jgi:hypothetical protein
VAAAAAASGDAPGHLEVGGEVIAPFDGIYGIEHQMRTIA